MRTIIGNVFYDTDKCEMVAMRKSGSGMHEYLLRSPNGQLLLAESLSATCLGRLPMIGDVAIENNGRMVEVRGTSSDGSCRVQSSQGEGTWDVPRGGLSSCKVYFRSLRLFKPGEPCDGFIVEECTWKRLIELGLITRGDEL